MYKRNIYEFEIKKLKLKLCSAVLSCFLLAGGVNAATGVQHDSVKVYNTIPNIKIYKNLSNIKITDNYLNQVRKAYEYYNYSKNYEQAQKFITYYVDLNTKKYGECGNNTIYALIKQINFALDTGNYDLARKVNDKFDKILKSNLDLENKYYILNAIFSYYMNIENYIKALETLKMINEEELQEWQKIELYSSYVDVYKELGDLKKAKAYLDKYKKIAVKDNNIYTEDAYWYYLKEMNYEASLKDKNYSKVLAYVEKLNDISDKLSGEEKKEDTNYTNTLVEYYKDALLIDKAIDEIKRLDNNSNGSKGNEIANMYFDTYKYANEYQKMYEYLQKLKKYSDKMPQKSLKRLEYYDKERDYYVLQKNQNKIIKIIDKGLALSIPEKDNAPNLYAKYLNYLSEYYQNKNQLEKSLEYKNEAFHIFSELYSENSLKYVEEYKKYAEINNSMMRNEEALNYYKKALDITISVQGKTSISVADILKSISATYSSLGENNRALSTMDKAIKIYKNSYGKNSIRVYDAMLQTTNYMKDDKKAKIIDEIISADEKGIIEGYDKRFFFNLYSKAASLYEKKDEQKAYAYRKKAESYSL